MRLVFVSNVVAGGWSPRAMNDVGGSEESLVYLARALVRRGHEVTVVYDGPTLLDELSRGSAVRYRPRTDPGTAYDLAVLYKCPDAAGMQLAPRQWLWTVEERAFNGQPFEWVVVPSHYLSRCLLGTCPPLEPKLAVIPYGLELRELLGDGSPAERDSGLVLHTASPDRGLETLLQVWPAVLEKRPDARLVCTYGFERYEACGGGKNLRDRIERLCIEQPSVHLPPSRRTMRELANFYRAAGVWAYYCTGGEFFCLAAVKAQQAGCVPVVRPWGALQETVWSGLRADTPEAFRDALIDALDPARQEELRAAIGTCPIPTWDEVAAQWEQLFAQPVPAPAATKLLQVPATPDGLVPRPGANAIPTIVTTSQEWAQQLGVAVPWVAPSLGFSAGPTSPASCDGAILGFEVEDAATDPLRTLATLPLRANVPVLLISSFGPWRADKRRRHFSRRDLQELFGQCPDAIIRAVALDGEGNGFFATSFRFRLVSIGKRDLQRVRRTAAPRETVSVCFIAPPTQPEGVFLRALRSVQSIADEIVCAVNPRPPELVPPSEPPARVPFPEHVLTGDPRPFTEIERDMHERRELETIEARIRRKAPPGMLANAPTVDLLEDFGRETGIPVTVVEGMSPHWCHDCRQMHAKGEMTFGHRLAGFETPRNQSIAPARGDHILWIDTDEVIEGAANLAKYLRPNGFAGYAVQQHHHSVDPPQATKIDWPVRLFRRIADGSAAGWSEEGPLKWPTFSPGFTARFAGIVHEHPGGGQKDAHGRPIYSEGVAPVVMLSDIFISHVGYLSEAVRRARFLRNWALMACDRLRYPRRRLGLFLGPLRDLTHHLRYGLERLGNRLEFHFPLHDPRDCMHCRMVTYAEECLRVYQEEFVDREDPFAADALMYASGAAQVLNRGIDVQVSITARKPEVTGDEHVDIAFAGRIESAEVLLKMIKSRLPALTRWEGMYL